MSVEQEEEELYDEFPDMFEWYHNDYPAEPRPPISMGIQCGEGWIPIIKDLCEDLDEMEAEFKFVQIKEKFGGLRAYTEGVSGDDAQEALELIHEAEENSYNVCEKCGDEGEISRNGGWIRTRCDECDAAGE